MYLGTWEIDDLLTFTVTTHTFATGALTDADGNPAYRVYEDETGTAILTGSMAKLDDANTTGHYSEQITLSAANGFEVGKSYSIYITAAVAGVTGGTTRGFQVEAAPATAAVLTGVANDVAAALADTNELQTDWANGGRLDAILDARASQTAVDDLPTNSELATALGTADDTVLAAIAALNNLSSAGAQAAALAALAAYDAATGADVDAATAGLSTFDPTADAVIVGSIQTDAVSAAAIAAAAANKIADAALSRSYSHVEDTAGDHSLAALIAGALESVIAGTTWTIYKTDGVTVMLTKTVATDGAAEPITGVA